MNLYLIHQEVNSDYDTYSGAVVAAEDEQGAKFTHPGKGPNWDDSYESCPSWCHVDEVKVELIGKAVAGTVASVICDSFNAG